MLSVTADELPRIMLCNGSRLMPASYPVLDSDPTARDEGTAAHYMAAAVFKNEFLLEEMIDRKAPNGFYMSSDMAEYVDGYLRILQGGEVEADTSFGNDAWRINGRCDHRFYDSVADRLTIPDLKYGFRITEPHMNWTLIAHAIGTCLMMQIQPREIVLQIYQPRPFHPDGKLREWRITFDQLWDYYSIINATLCDPTNELHTGPIQCPKCPALATCPSARAASMNAIDATTLIYSDDLPNDVLSYELDLLTQAEATMTNRLNALKELAKHRVRSAQVVPNYAMTKSYGHRKFNQGLTAEFLRIVTGVDLSKPGLCTPKEAERRGVPEIVLKTLTDRPMIGEKLERVTADDQAKRLLKKGTQLT